MIDNDAELIRRLKVATNDKPYNKNPVVSSKDIVDAEALLGFSLPPLLKSIYLEVRDGGFGPFYHIFPLIKGSDSVVSFYFRLKKSTQEDVVMYTEGRKEISYWDGEVPMLWPDKVLPICSYGCSRISCVDCSKPELPVLVQDDGNEISQFALESHSLSLWLEDWLDQKVSNFHWDTARKIPFDAFH